MNLAWFLSVAAFALAMAATPGPNNTMVTASGANYGFRRSLPHLLGITVGFPVMILVLGTIGLPVLANARVHGALKWVGALYLLWLAVKIALADPGDSDSGDGDPTAEKVGSGKPLTFLQAALFQWVNPKAWIIVAGALATYTAAGPDGSPLASTMALAAIFMAMTFPSAALWTMIGVGAARFLKSRQAKRTFNWAMAALLVASLVSVVLE